MKNCLLNYMCSLLMVISNVYATHHESHYTEIECTLVPIKKAESHCSHPHIPGPRSARTPSNQASSTNWSGYVAANNLSHPTAHSVTAVSGSWIVPTVVTSGGNTYSSMWVGIDGYTSSTVEQIGTEHDFINGVQQHYAWFEMYPGGSYLINGFPLRVGDVISASVTYIGNNTFVLIIMNDTKQVSFTVPTTYTKSSTAVRNCAEWVVEAPYLNGILPLSNFGTAYLWGCMATINGLASFIGNNAWQNTGIQMVTNNGIPKDTTSSLLPDRGSFFVTWSHK
jgi:hypothetical protein